MHVRIENEQIKIYPSLPNRYRSESLNVAGGFALLPESVHKAEGFYPLVTPAFNEASQKLGDLYFDATNEIFTQEVIGLSEYEIAIQDWGDENYSIKITASSDLIDMYPSVAIWMQLNGLPVIMSDDSTQVYLFMNEIKPQHQELFDLLLASGDIIIENRPLA